MNNFNISFYENEFSGEPMMMILPCGEEEGLHYRLEGKEDILKFIGMYLENES